MTTDPKWNSKIDRTKEALALLESFLKDGAELADLPKDLRQALFVAAGRLSRPDRDQLRLRNRSILKAKRQMINQKNRQARAATGIREARKKPVYNAPLEIPAAPETQEELSKESKCYVCKAKFTKLHFFYDCMCPTCAEFNYRKRFQSAPMDGQVALITGARLKIGYQAALMMLRAGAKVVVTTRFPVDAATRYAKERDFEIWKDRLSIHGLDLRHTPSVELFTRLFEQNYGRLDILINNAAQTVRRPPGFYAHLIALETAPTASLDKNVQLLLQAQEAFKGRLPQIQNSRPELALGLQLSAKLSQIPYSFDYGLLTQEVFPEGKLDQDLQQVDLRSINSWRLTLPEVETPEMLEVQLINSVAPFVLCSRLIPLMKKHPTGKKHIVNVTAMEGKFSHYTKTDKHPHTNMAKAALNMLTLTSAPGLAEEGIFMNAVDTGWVTDEDPAAISLRKQAEHDFEPPLDIVDGAARVCDPFFSGLNTGVHVFGKFLKDYQPTAW